MTDQFTKRYTGGRRPLTPTQYANRDFAELGQNFESDTEEEEYWEAIRAAVVRRTQKRKKRVTEIARLVEICRQRAAQLAVVHEHLAKKKIAAEYRLRCYGPDVIQRQIQREANLLALCCKPGAGAEMLAKLERLTAENEHLKLVSDAGGEGILEMEKEFTERIERLEAELASLKAENADQAEELRTLRRIPKGEVWYWQGDGHDMPESLACPVIMEPQILRDLMANNQRLRAKLCSWKEDSDD